MSGRISVEKYGKNYISLKEMIIKDWNNVTSVLMSSGGLLLIMAAFVKLSMATEFLPISSYILVTLLKYALIAYFILIIIYPFIVYLFTPVHVLQKDEEGAFLNHEIKGGKVRTTLRYAYDDIKYFTTKQSEPLRQMTQIGAIIQFNTVISIALKNGEYHEILEILSPKKLEKAKKFIDENFNIPIIDEKQILKDARKYSIHDEAETSLLKYDQILKINSKDIKISAERDFARSSMNEGNVAAVINYYYSIIEIYESSLSNKLKDDAFYGYCVIAKSERLIDNHKDAIRLYSKALKIYSKDAFLYFLRASVEYKLQKSGSALKDIQKAIKLVEKPECELSRYSKAKVYYLAYLIYASLRNKEVAAKYNKFALDIIPDFDTKSFSENYLF